MIIIIIIIIIIITLFNNNNNNNNNDTTTTTNSNAQYLASVWFWELLALALTNVVRVHTTVMRPLLDRLLPVRTWFCFEVLNLLGTKRHKNLNKKYINFLLWTRKLLDTPNYFDKTQKWNQCLFALHKLLIKKQVHVEAALRTALLSEFLVTEEKSLMYLCWLCEVSSLWSPSQTSHPE